MTIVQTDPDYLAHFGILGMKWGVRRYQNEDGSLTPAGLRRRQSEVYKQNRAKAKAKTAQTRAQAKIDAQNAKNAVRLNKQLIKEQQRQIKDAAKKTTEQAKADEPKNSHGFTRSDLKNMSDKDLQAALNRAQNEKQLRQLLDEQKSPMQRALANAGNTVLNTVVTGGALFATRSLLNRITDSNLGNVVMAAGGKNFMDFQRNSHEEEYDEPKLTRAERRAARYEAQTERIKAETARAKAQTDRAKAEQDLKNARAKSGDTGKKEPEQNKNAKNKSSDNSKPAKQDRSQKTKEDAAKQDAYEESRQQQSLAIRPSSATQTAPQSNTGYETGRRAGQVVGRAMRLLGSGRSSSTPQLPAHTPSTPPDSGSSRRSGLSSFISTGGKHQAGRSSSTPQLPASASSSSGSSKRSGFGSFFSTGGKHQAGRTSSGGNSGGHTSSQNRIANETYNQRASRNVKDIQAELYKQYDAHKRGEITSAQLKEYADKSLAEIRRQNNL